MTKYTDMLKDTETTARSNKVLDTLDWFSTETANFIIIGDLIMTLKRVRPTTTTPDVHKTSAISFNKALVNHIIHTHSSSLPLICDPKDPINGPKKRELRLAVSFGKSKGDTKYLSFNPSSNTKHFVIKRGKNSASINNSILLDAFWLKLGIPDRIHDIKLKVKLDTNVQSLTLYTFTVLDMNGKPFFN